MAYVIYIYHRSTIYRISYISSSSLIFTIHSSPFFCWGSLAASWVLEVQTLECGVVQVSAGDSCFVPVQECGVDFRPGALAWCYPRDVPQGVGGRGHRALPGSFSKKENRRVCLDVFLVRCPEIWVQMDLLRLHKSKTDVSDFGFRICSYEFIWYIDVENVFSRSHHGPSGLGYPRLSRCDPGPPYLGQDLEFHIQQWSWFTEKHLQFENHSIFIYIISIDIHYTHTPITFVVCTCKLCRNILY